MSATLPVFVLSWSQDKQVAIKSAAAFRSEKETVKEEAVNKKAMNATMKRAVTTTMLVVLGATCAVAEKLDVKVLNRQDNEDTYDYTGVYNNTVVGKTFKVRGATFTLQLPDNRLVVVNCESKFAEHMAGRAGNRRSCRVPLVSNIQVDFNGDKAKLIWPVSIDGKKMESETYKILGILEEPKSN